MHRLELSRVFFWLVVDLRGTARARVLSAFRLASLTINHSPSGWVGSECAGSRELGVFSRLAVQEVRGEEEGKIVLTQLGHFHWVFRLLERLSFD